MTEIAKLRALWEATTSGEWHDSPPYEDEFGCKTVSIGPHPVEPPAESHYEDTIAEVWGNEYDAVANAAFIPAAHNQMGRLLNVAEAADLLRCAIKTGNSRIVERALAQFELKWNDLQSPGHETGDGDE